MPIAEELRAAIGDVSGVGAWGRDLPREAHVGGLIFHPILGAAVGAAAGAAAQLASAAGTWAAAAAAVAVLAATSPARTFGPPRRSPGRLVGMLAGIAAKLWAVATLPAAARTVALALAAMLGRWSIVVQCYGGTPVAAHGPAARIVGRARLREFGWASALAFGSAMAVLDAIGLLVLLVATLVTMALRVLAYRRAGGVSGATLGVSAEVVETLALVVLAAVARA